MNPTLNRVGFVPSWPSSAEGLFPTKTSLCSGLYPASLCPRALATYHFLGSSPLASPNRTAQFLVYRYPLCGRDHAAMTSLIRKRTSRYVICVSVYPAPARTQHRGHTHKHLWGGGRGRNELCLSLLINICLQK